jgi:hypothetical protein
MVFCEPFTRQMRVPEQRQKAVENRPNTASCPAYREKRGGTGGAMICTAMAGRTTCHVVLYCLPWQEAAQLRASGNSSCCCRYFSKCT